MICFKKHLTTRGTRAIRTNIDNTEKDNFRKGLEIRQSDEELKIIKLQKEYKAGNIHEEDMTDDEHEKLIDLYKRQNEKLKEKINIKRQNLRRRLDALKAS